MSAGSVNPFARNLDAFLGPSARRTLVLVGHLPVMSGLWISQYADREARESGAVALVRIEQDAVQVELFRAGSRSPAVSARSSLAEALRAIAPVVSSWLVVPRASTTAPATSGFSNVVVLTGSDEAAVVAAYGIIKGCAEAAAPGRTPPPTSVAVLGADASETERVAERLARTTRAFLDVDLPVRGGLQRVAPVESAFRGTFDAPSPTLAQVLEAISTAEREAARVTASTSAPAPTPTFTSTPTPDFSPASRGDRFGARPERVPPRRSLPRDESPIPFARPEPAAHRAVPAMTPTPAELAAARTTVRSAVFRKGAVVEPEAATPVGALPAPVARGLVPEPAVVHAARRIDVEPGDALVARVEGFVATPFRAPRHPDVELATDATGRLRIVGRPSQLGAMLAVRSWAREHLAILRLACAAIVSNEDAALDVVTSSHREARDVEGVDAVWVLSKVEVAGRQGFLVEAV